MVDTVAEAVEVAAAVVAVVAGVADTVAAAVVAAAGIDSIGRHRPGAILRDCVSPFLENPFGPARSRLERVFPSNGAHRLVPRSARWRKLMPARNSKDAQLSKRLDEALGRLGARDRANIEKHLTALGTETDSKHAQLWRRLAGKLCELSPLPMQAIGAQAVIFFAPDGKYRMQVYALEDNRDGNIVIYLPDVTAQAVKEKVLVKSGEGFAVAGSKARTLTVDALDAGNTPEPAQHVKHMIGWNRKAVRVTIPVTSPDSPEVAAAEALCSLAARQWASAVKA